MADVRADVVVVGAGVIGLTVGVCIAEQGLRVLLCTRSDPSATTSSVATAMIGPGLAPGYDPTGVRERASIEEFTALADVDGTGVAMRRGRLAARQPGPSLPGLEPCRPQELPDGFATGFWATLPLVDMALYLDYLVRRLHAAGGRIEHRELTSLRELATLAPLVANCAGLGARELVPDETVRPLRGQHVIIDNPGLDEFFIEAPFGPAWAGYFPYPDHVVLGGTAVDADNAEPDLAVADQIRQRCIEVEPRLRHARVRGHQVGLRPMRPSVRLEVEELDGARCVHNYGHGGSGVTLSWGCARETAALLTGQGTERT
ncbi:MAG: FAD-binding oxidoreductase [Acidimicrobiia bacterium]|nr:FAD-binding oxidoreductase [Acidimicrobiia bacterium]